MPGNLKKKRNKKKKQNCFPCYYKYFFKARAITQRPRYYVQLFSPPVAFPPADVFNQPVLLTLTFIRNSSVYYFRARRDLFSSSPEKKKKKKKKEKDLERQKGKQGKYKNKRNAYSNNTLLNNKV
ncbi:hypothetical protein PUN28_005449 [Cardiocondyla obscurior]|uniref:Uncharacterized protein n=1 Tax=Cardiocondyla obscurior TaxID=286306 RepID=A0AAW2GKZ7_9HYME